jgi:hypothetical protein
MVVNSCARSAPTLMNQETIALHKSRTKLYIPILFIGTIIISYFLSRFDGTYISYNLNPVLTIILGILFFCLFFYYIRELITQKPEIVLSSDGIEIRDKGYFNWDMIKSMKTIHYYDNGDNDVDVIFYFKEFDRVKFNLSFLGKTREEMIELILQFSGNNGISYLGNETR